MGMIFAMGAGLCCLALGLTAGAALTRRQRRLTAWLQALERMEQGLQSRLSMAQVLNLGDLEELRAMARSLEKEPLLGLGEAWQRSAGQDQEPERQVLAALFNHLGQGDLAHRRQALEQAAVQIEILAQKARQAAERNRPLYRSLGGLGGLALTLLLI
ncbi:MAG: hypothetical protein IJ461_00855 [Clostridia bacterium]|nr:hypothetical protein [Clostridia bacterium]